MLHLSVETQRLARQRPDAGAPDRPEETGTFRRRSGKVGASRGESAYVWEEPDAYRAMVVEGLGTKSLVADAVRPLSGRSHFDALAQDTVAMIVNEPSQGEEGQ